MSQSRLIELSYFDPGQSVRLTVYADTIILDRDGKEQIISAVRFGGYPEVVRAMSDAMYGGVTVEARISGKTEQLRCKMKGYHRQHAHDGVYATATLLANDDERSAEKCDNEEDETSEDPAAQPRKNYIFCPAGDRDRLFEELDHKTAAPLIPQFRDYVLEELEKRGDLRQMTVISLKRDMDAWVLELKPEDANVVEILENGLKSGKLTIPGAQPNVPDGFENVGTVTDYLNTFGVTVADRIRGQFQPLFDPASEPLSEEILAINDYIQEKAGYPLYDAQLAVAEVFIKYLLSYKSELV